MAREETAKTPAEETRAADTTDGGWSVESHSAPTTETPIDTTVQVDADGDELDADSAKPAASTGRQAPAAKEPAGKRNKNDPNARISEINRKWRATESELESERRARADLERRITELTTKAEPKPEVKADLAKAAPGAKAADVAQAFPDHPVYSAFETDEDYTKAVAKWREDVQTWQTARDERLIAKVTGTVDERLQAERDASERTAHEAAVVTRLRAVHDAHPDFSEKVAAVAESLKSVRSPFLIDMVTNHDEGGELLYDLASDADLALALGDLELPTRPLADAVRSSSAMRAIVKYFGTDEGREDFDRLRTLPSGRVYREIGKLEARLEDADRGPSSVARPITGAVPPAKPPVGGPRARVIPGSSTKPTESFDAWMASEDEAERQKKLRRAGVAVSA